MNNEPIKMLPEELNEIKELQNKINEKVFQFGNLYLEKMQIDSMIKSVADKESSIQTSFQNLQKEENVLIEKILKKYGEGSLDLKAGTFIPENSA